MQEKQQEEAVGTMAMGVKETSNTSAVSARWKSF